MSLSELIDSCLISDREMQVRLGQFWYPIDVTENEEMEEILNDCNSGRVWLQERDYGSSGCSGNRQFAAFTQLDWTPLVDKRPFHTHAHRTGTLINEGIPVYYSTCYRTVSISYCLLIKKGLRHIDVKYRHVKLN